MKVLKNKKTMLSLFLGVLMTVSVVGAGTFAWFTGSATVSTTSQISTSRVAVGGTLQLDGYSFFPIENEFNVNYFAMARMEEISVMNADQISKNAEFAGYLIGAGVWADLMKYDRFDEIINSDGTLNKTLDATALHLIKMVPWNGITNEVWGITPGSILTATASFSVRHSPGGNSDIPVYFRVKAADFEFSGDASNVTYLQAATAVVRGTALNPINNEIAYGTTVAIDAKLEKSGDYYYLNVPLSPHYGWAIDIVDILYLDGNNTQEDIPSTLTLSYADVEAEVIQATNNAIFFADGWRELALEGFFYDIADPVVAGLTTYYPLGTLPSLLP
jgi:hypothetical protein